MKLVLIPAGEFLMGSADTDGEAYANEKPQHLVRLTRPFYLAAHEVTQGQYEKLIGNNPSHFAPNGSAAGKVAGQPTPQFPVEKVSWLEAVLFCNTLEREGGLETVLQARGGDGERARLDGAGVSSARPSRNGNMRVVRTASRRFRSVMIRRACANTAGTLITQTAKPIRSD